MVALHTNSYAPSPSIHRDRSKTRLSVGRCTLILSLRCESYVVYQTHCANIFLQGLEKKDMTISFETLSTNGIHLLTALAGPKDGEPVFLLHGFPEAWFGWEAQIGPLAEAGFRVIVPDQRGYNLSDKPIGVSNYGMNILAQDILGLADALGYERFHLAGHDFGAMVSWNLAMHHPARIKRLAIANVPHPTVMQNYLPTHLSQILKSWYAFFFQLPNLPERIVKAKKLAFSNLGYAR